MLLINKLIEVMKPKIQIIPSSRHHHCRTAGLFLIIV